MNCPKCKPPIKPRDLETPIVDLYRGLLSGPDLGAAHNRAMQLLKERTSFGAQDAAEAWTESLLTLLLQKGMLVSLDELNKKGDQK